MKSKKKLPVFLCDTWWYGLTQRINEKEFLRLARLRVKQGFTAIQLVVGIPPEIGPENPSAWSIEGPAWNLKGNFNSKYLKLAKTRIEQLNSLGLTAIVYGAWGHQIGWLGVQKMKRWWQAIVKNLDGLNVIYCLTGESDLWIGKESLLLPNKTTDDLRLVKAKSLLPLRVRNFGWRILSQLKKPLDKKEKETRRRQWSQVLSYLSGLTKKLILIHVAGVTSNEAVNNPRLLSAVTVQTGHDITSKPLLWKLPFETVKSNPKVSFVNLEPWYEGIKDSFGPKDQLFAYWASMMAGASAYCYGAHGIWNIGDGQFLSHWGKQTFKQAIELDTPRLIGISHRLFVQSGFEKYKQVEIERHGNELIKITRSGKKGAVTYIPEVSRVNKIPKGKMFLPAKGCFAKIKPKSDSLVIITEP